MEHLIHIILLCTGILVWCLLLLAMAAVIINAALSFWRTTIRPSLSNLLFALTGKPRGDRRSYYEYWSTMPRHRYRYYTRGAGRRNFNRCALKRLLYEARKESLKR